MAKRKQSSLLPNFGLTSEKFKWGDQNVGEEARSAATANIHAGLTSLVFVNSQCNTGALVKGRPRDCHRMFRMLIVLQRIS